MATAPNLILPGVDEPQWISWEEFEQLPDGDGYHRELIDGELQILPPVKLRHSKVAKRIFKALLRAEEAAGGQAFFEAGFKLAADPASWVEPDVSFVLGQRVEDTDDASTELAGATEPGAAGSEAVRSWIESRPGPAPAGYFMGGPELAIEVVSPSERARHLNRKVDLMLSTGSRAVWVVYPEQREVRCFLPDGTSVRRGSGEPLWFPELLPGWEMAVAKVFED